MLKSIIRASAIHRISNGTISGSIENCGEIASATEAPAHAPNRIAAYPPMLDPYVIARSYLAAIPRTISRTFGISGYWYQRLADETTWTASTRRRRRNVSPKPGRSRLETSVYESNV